MKIFKLIEIYLVGDWVLFFKYVFVTVAVCLVIFDGLFFSGLFENHNTLASLVTAYFSWCAGAYSNEWLNHFKKNGLYK